MLSSFQRIPLTCKPLQPTKRALETKTDKWGWHSEDEADDKLTLTMKNDNFR